MRSFLRFLTNLTISYINIVTKPFPVLFYTVRIAIELAMKSNNFFCKMELSKSIKIK